MLRVAKSHIARTVLQRSSMRFANYRGAVHVHTPEGFLMVDIDIYHLLHESAWNTARYFLSRRWMK